MNTKNSEGYYSLKSTERFNLESTERNRILGLDPRSTLTKPPLTKFTFERSVKDKTEADVSVAVKLNSSFTLGRHPKLT